MGGPDASCLAAKHMNKIGRFWLVCRCIGFLGLLLLQLLKDEPALQVRQCIACGS